MVRCSKKAKAVAAALPGLLKNLNRDRVSATGILIVVRGLAPVGLRSSPEMENAVYLLDRGGCCWGGFATQRGQAPSPQVIGVSATAHNRDVILGPAAVRYELAAFSLRGCPEGDFLELVETVGLATLGAQQFAALASRRHRWQRAEPRGDVTLDFRLQRPVHPLVGAVRVFGLGVQHGGVGPAGSAFLGNSRGNRLFLVDQAVDLIRPGAGGDHAFVLEVTHLHGG